MAVYRYRLSSPSASRVGKALDVVPTISTQYPPIFVDVTTTGTKDDLDEAMAREGYAYDSTAPTTTVDVQAGAASSPPAQIREVAIAGKPFTSVSAAIADITDATSTKPYTVLVYPGVYTESPITMKTYVHVKGVGGWFDTVLATNDNSNNFINLAAGGSLSHVAVVGPTGAGFAALDYQGTGTTPCIVDDIVIRKGYYGVNVHPASSGTLHCHSVVNQYAGTQINQFMRVTNGNLTAITCSFMSGPSASVVTGWYVSGSSASATLDTCSFRGAGSTDALFVDSGAVVRSHGLSIDAGTTGIHIGATGPIVDIGAVGTRIAATVTTAVKTDTAACLILFQGVADFSTFNLASGTPISGIVTDADGSGGTVVLGELNKGVDNFPLGVFTDAIRATGVHTGGGFQRVSGLQVKALAGTGFLVNGSNSFKHVTWVDTTLTLPINTDLTYITVNSSGVVSAATTPPDVELLIKLGQASTNATAVTWLAASQILIDQRPARIYEYLTETIGPMHYTGSVTSKHTTPSLQLDVASGEYYTGSVEHVHTGGSPITFTYWYQNASSVWVAVSSQTSVDATQYNLLGTGLVTMTAGKYRRDLLFVSVSDSGTEFHVVYGQQQFDSSVLSTVNPLTPDHFQRYSCRLAGVVVLKSASDIDSVIDQRPKTGQFASSSSSGITVHNDLTGRDSSVAHTQYQLSTEKGDASGYAPLNASTKIDNTYIQTATAAGATVAPGGAAVGSGPKLAFEDHNHSIGTGSPVAIGTANNAGTGTTVSLANHVHDHGAQTANTLHAVTSLSGGAGFAPKCNFSATTDPGTGNDNTQGYLAGSQWVNTAAGTEWFAASVGTSTAVWKQLANAGTMLVQKAGTVLAASFAGSPKKATVTFTTAFAAATYSVTLMPVITASGTLYAPNVESLGTTGFTINMGANTISSLISVRWTAHALGESS